MTTGVHPPRPRGKEATMGYVGKHRASRPVLFRGSRLLGGPVLAGAGAAVAVAAGATLGLSLTADESRPVVIADTGPGYPADAPATRTAAENRPTSPPAGTTSAKGSTGTAAPVAPTAAPTGPRATSSDPTPAPESIVLPGLTAVRGVSTTRDAPIDPIDRIDRIDRTVRAPGPTPDGTTAD